MSPNQGRKPTSGSGGSGAGAARSAGPAAVRRLGLLIFGVAFVLLFLVVAISEGLGDPSVPSGDIAVVEDAPGDLGNISEADFDRALAQAAAQGGKKEVPKEGDDAYEELAETAIGSLLDAVWLRGQAEEMGISVTEKEVEKELEKLKDENFKDEAEYEKFLEESKFTQADVDARVELQMLSTQIQDEINTSAPKPSQSEIEDYYDAAKPTQFTLPESRDIRSIVNKDEAKAEEAKAQLEEDGSAKSWKKVAAEFSEDSLTKEKGGLQKSVIQGILEEPLDEAVFDTPEDRIEGPIETEKGFNVFVVENTTPKDVQELKDVASQIKSQLEQQIQQEVFGEFVADYSSRWKSRTFCREGFRTDRCSNFEFPGHSPTAPPACYEESPKKAPEACPAPVFQLVPAMPGTVTPLEPRGKPLAQRPRPPGEEKVEETPELGGIQIPQE